MSRWGAMVLGGALALSLAQAAAALPDLVPEVFDIELVRSARVDPGDVVEGCSDAESGRTLLRFSLRTRNVGVDDLVLGNPGCPDCALHPGAACSNPLYICAPAHNHAHFASYIEASLFDAQGRRVGLGRKVGFCVFDLECKTPQFTCEFQGLSAGCADVYGTGLPCQYIDLTDARVPSGDYRLQVEVDPDHVLAESNEENNVVSTTVHITDTTDDLGVTRRNWVPDSGPDVLGHSLGDMWTFSCPAGGEASVKVDTVADTDDGRSTIDPVVFVVDPRGTRVAVGDDDFVCSVPPSCGFRCPDQRHISCGDGGTFSIVVRDFSNTSNGCVGGGGYVLTVGVTDNTGAEVPDKQIQLGGGARRRVPLWADPTRSLIQGPALDDEGVPF